MANGKKRSDYAAMNQHCQERQKRVNDRKVNWETINPLLFNCWFIYSVFWCRISDKRYLHILFRIIWAETSKQNKQAFVVCAENDEYLHGFSSLNFSILFIPEFERFN